MPDFVVFSDDWGRHPSSCQHLFRQLLPRYRTFWVNRSQQPTEELGVKPDGIGTGMADLVKFVLAA